MIQIITTFDEVFCHILPMLDGLNELIKLSQSQLCFVCDLFLSMNLCQTYFYCPPLCNIWKCFTQQPFRNSIF